MPNTVVFCVGYNIFAYLIFKAILHLSKKHTGLLTAHLLEALDEVSNSELFKKFCSIFVSCLLHNMETPMTTFEVSQVQGLDIEIEKYTFSCVLYVAC